MKDEEIKKMLDEVLATASTEPLIAIGRKLREMSAGIFSEMEVGEQKLEIHSKDGDVAAYINEALNQAHRRGLYVALEATGETLIDIATELSAT